MTSNLSTETNEGDLHPLRRFSLLNSAHELRRLAQEQTPLLGNVCLKGQTTVWYAKPNTGKTLICMSELPAAVQQGRLRGEDAYYVAADDNPAGVLEKIEQLQPYGIHVLAPGFLEFDPRHLTTFLQQMIDEDKAKDSFVILDTLKKAVSLMDKRESSGFADFARRYVMRGGTFLGLAHTNKRTDKDGRPIFAGTSDILDDFDCGYTIMEISQGAKAGERVVQFDCIKSRGNVAQQVAYAYDDRGYISYAERVKSVRRLADDELTNVQRESEVQRDAQIIDVILDAIRDGQGAGGKMELAKEVSARTKIGRHTIGAIIDKYAGDDWTVHRWKYEVGDRGKRGYVLVERPLTPEEQKALDDAF